jgi:hypothetical protein
MAEHLVENAETFGRRYSRHFITTVPLSRTEGGVAKDRIGWGWGHNVLGSIDGVYGRTVKLYTSINIIPRYQAFLRTGT